MVVNSFAACHTREEFKDITCFFYIHHHQALMPSALLSVPSASGDPTYASHCMLKISRQAATFVLQH